MPMDVSTIIGVIAGVILVAYGISVGGPLSDFYDFGSILITFGGALTATFASFSLSTFKRVPGYFKVINRKNKYTPQYYIEAIVGLAQEARRKGILTLEEKVKEVDDVFLNNSVMLIVDAIEPEKTKQILEDELNNLESRHSEGWMLFEKMASFSPAFGMIGTLIGLVQMLKNMDLDVAGGAKAMAQGMATALITTFYGVIFANLVCLPLANKLRRRHDEEMLIKEIIVEGVLSIQSGENPNHIKERLSSYLESSKRNTEAGEDKKAAKKTRKEKLEKNAL